MEKKDIKDLQKIIDSKAKSKLDKDVQKFVNFLHDSSNFSTTNSFIDIATTLNFGLMIDKDHIGKFRDTFWSVDSFAFKKVKELLLPKYIEIESELFADTVNNLEESLRDLLDDELNNRGL